MIHPQSSTFDHQDALTLPIKKRPWLNLPPNSEETSFCRHTQGTEGEALVALFPKGLKVLDGGVKGALTSAEDKTAPKLYCVSGKRRFKVSSVPVEAASLNSRDGFVLDCGSEDLIVQWVNTNAPPALKFRTLDLADELEQEYHGCSAQVFHLYDLKDSHSATGLFRCLRVQLSR